MLTPRYVRVLEQDIATFFLADARSVVLCLQELVPVEVVGLNGARDTREVLGAPGGGPFGGFELIMTVTVITNSLCDVVALEVGDLNFPRPGSSPGALLNGHLSGIAGSTRLKVH